MTVRRLLTTFAAATLALVPPVASALAADPIAAMPPEAVGSRIAAAFGVGGQALDLGSLETGVRATGEGGFDADTASRLAGPVFSAAVGGQVGDTPYSLELSGSVALLEADGSATQSFSGNGSLFVAGLANLGDASLALSAAAAPGGASALADARIAGDGGAAASRQSTRSPEDGRTALIGYAPLVATGGGAVTAVGTDGSQPSATAFGAVGSGGGFALGAVGDLGGLSVTTDVDESLDQSVVALRFGRSFDAWDGWAVTPTLAPTYRRIDRKIRSVTNFDLAPGSAAAARLPDARIDTIEELEANYYGGAVGATLSGLVGEGVYLNLGGELGLAHYEVDYDGRGRAQVASERLPYLFDTGRNGAAGQSENDLTYFGSARLGLALVQGRTVVSVGAQAEYLADVPTLSRHRYENLTFSADSTSAAAGSGAPTSRLATTSAWSYGGNVGVTFRF